ncbi:MAG: hypothetical protein ACFB2Z_11020 [Maricaulaceae bacterium]
MTVRGTVFFTPLGRRRGLLGWALDVVAVIGVIVAFVVASLMAAFALALVAGLAVVGLGMIWLTARLSRRRRPAPSGVLEARGVGQGWTVDAPGRFGV